MALKPVSTKHVTKLVCNFCGHIQDDFGVSTEHEGEEPICTCPVCNIGELQYKQTVVTEYVERRTDDNKGLS